jgi:hypothetical protein
LVWKTVLGLVWKKQPRFGLVWKTVLGLIWVRKTDLGLVWKRNTRFGLVWKNRPRYYFMKDNLYPPDFCPLVPT